MTEQSVLIIGAGLSGLQAGRILHEHGVPCQILEASDSIGGRVKTDSVDGFLLDHGFQVLLSSYEEIQDSYDVKALELCSFKPGAYVRIADSFYCIGDPLRDPMSLLSTLCSPIGSLSDKAKIGFLSLLARTPLWKYDSNYIGDSRSLLDSMHFSDTMIERFIKPFFSGVLLDSNLSSEAWFVKYLFQKFTSGYATLPKAGMRVLASELASTLPPDAIRLSTRVKQVKSRRLILDDGTEIHGRAILIACDRRNAEKLLGFEEENLDIGRATTCFYFKASGIDWIGNRLVINGSGKGVINTLCIPNAVASSYAPKDSLLLSVSTLETSDEKDVLLRIVQKELESWFGANATEWPCIRSYTIPYALPSQWGNLEAFSDTNDDIFICGDYTEQPSIQGALRSGRQAGHNIMSRLIIT